MANTSKKKLERVIARISIDPKVWDTFSKIWIKRDKSYALVISLLIDEFLENNGKHPPIEETTDSGKRKKTPGFNIRKKKWDDFGKKCKSLGLSKSSCLSALIDNCNKKDRNIILSE